MRIESTIISPLVTTGPLHAHPCWEIILNLSGHGIEHVGDQTRLFKPGSVTICPPQVQHMKYSDESQEEWQDIAVCFEDEAGIFHPKSLWFEDDANHTLETILRLLHRLYCDPAIPRQASNALADAATALISGWEQKDRPDKITETMKKEIFLHFSDPEFSVIIPMSVMNYCPDHIRRVFRQDTGMTPTAFLLKTRLAHAKRLLHNPAYSIREVAFLSGFYDPEYFCRLFHRENGLSPRNYRMHLEKKGAQKEASADELPPIC